MASFSGRIGISGDAGPLLMFLCSFFPERVVSFSRKPGWLCAPFYFAFGLVLAPMASHALESIVISPDQDRLEITKLADFTEGRGDKLQVETAPGADGIASRMSVDAMVTGTSPNWVVFALKNPTDKPIERWMVVDRYEIIGSGVLWPDLDARQIERVTPSLGFVPERVADDQADIFRVTIGAGKTVTYIAELSSTRFPRIHLWNPIAFEKKKRNRTLFNGMMLGIVGLLTIFLVAVFAANHRLIFPVSAILSMSVLAYFCIDFGFWHKIFKLTPETNAYYRAVAEASMAASIVIFLYAFLRIGVWHGWIRLLFGVWILVQLAIVTGAILDPRLAASFARFSFSVIAVLGSILILYLSLRGQDRALSIVPTWLLFLVWLFGAGVAVLGHLSGEIVSSALVAGLALILVLIGFTVTQYAFKSGGRLYGGPPNQMQIRSQAIKGAGASVWEWNARRDEINVSHDLEDHLGLNNGELNTRVVDWIDYIHPIDRERFRLMLQTFKEKGEGSVNIDFRLRRTDSSYKWFTLEAAAMPSSDNRTIKYAGLLRDVTDNKRAHERLMHDAVHDSLTGLPNRELFLDRLAVAIGRIKSEGAPFPTVIFIDIDRFKNVNNSFGLVVGDSMLLTMARRLARHLGPQDTLARVGGDQFAILFSTSLEPRSIAMLAERLRRSLRSPMKIAGNDIILTGSIGIAVYDGQQATHQDVLREAEIAMYRAKKSGADRIEIFRPDMRNDQDECVALESELRQAIEKKQIKILYQPIMHLAQEDLAGFEALIRWDHPGLGLLKPEEFLGIAEDSDIIAGLGSHVLGRSAVEAARWQKVLPKAGSPLSVSVNISSRDLFRKNLIQDIRHILGRETVPKGSLRLEITESLVMENPEQAVEILEWLRSAGAGLSMDDFGTGFSSLAYLHRFPFDTVKIDKSLVFGCGRDDKTRAIVQSIVVLSHELGKAVVAEGVETKEDAAYLRSIGCDYAQGYYFGPPMEGGDVIDLLKLIRKNEKREQKAGMFGALTRKNEEKSEAANASAPVNGSQQNSHIQPQPTAAIRPQSSPGQMPSQPSAAPTGDQVRHQAQHGRPARGQLITKLADNASK